MARTITINQDDNSRESFLQFRKAGEVLSLVDHHRVPVWKALGEPKPDSKKPGPYASMVQQYMSHLTGQGTGEE